MHKAYRFLLDFHFCCTQVPMLGLSMAVQRVANVYSNDASKTKAELEDEHGLRIKAEEALAEKAKEVHHLQATLKVRARLHVN